MSPLDCTPPGANILISWELGGGFGHLLKGAMLARHLLACGCNVSFAVRDLANAHALLPEDYYCLVQAPYFDGQLQNWPAPADYAELLLHAGWGQTAGLRARVRGWRGLFDALETDLLIADHAPTAILAARTLNIPCALWGHGFGVPTRSWPTFRTWETIPAHRLVQVRQLVLDTINATLEHFGTPTLAAPEQLFDTAANFLATWPELDHYPDRGGGDYCGPLWPANIGEAVWQEESSQPRIFAYLRPNLPGLTSVLQALAELDAEVIVHLSDHSSLDLPTISERLRFTGDLIDMSTVARQASLVLCSGTDTLHGMAVRGVPTLALPMNAEQHMGAERLSALGVGLMLIPTDQPDFQPAASAAMRQLLGTPTFREQAGKLKARYGHTDSTAALDDIAKRCLALCA